MNNVGAALMGQQLTEKALQKFEEAHKADPASAIPLLNKGIALLYLRRLAEAEDTLKQATTIDPENVRIWYCLGLAHLAESKSDPAIEDFKRAIKLNPMDADSHYYLGSLYRSLKDYDQAIGEFEEALRLNPLHASAQFGLASALQRSGKATQAREHLKRFQTITQTKVGTPLAVTYGEQGDYATVQNIRLPEQPVGPMIPVTFVAQAGAGGTSSSPAPAANQAGGGACILDVDGQKNIVAMSDGDPAIRVYKSLQSGALEEVPAQQTGLTASGHGIACAVGDYDSDGHPDLAVALSDRVILFRNLGHGKFEDVTKAAGIQQLNHPAGLTFVDFDHDGDVDLFATGSALSSGTGPDVLWRNNGNSTFTEWTGPTGLAGKGSTTAVALSDLNNDRAVDLIVTGDGSSPTIFENKREGAFKVLPLYADSGLAPTRGVLVFDFNKDGWMDVAVTHAGAPGISLWRNRDGEHFERVHLPLTGAEAAWGLTAIDIDNDGWIDLAAIVKTANGTGLRLWRNRGAQGFEDVSDATGLSRVKLQNPRSVIAADIDGDGAADLIVTQLNAPPIVLRNVGGSRNHSLRLTLAGLADNKTAIGTKVEVFSNGRSQKFEVGGGSGYLSQGSSEILAGLGQADKADVVRMLWPTGVPQDELDVAAGKPVTLTELDRRGSSCPVLFAWDGSRYQFVTDVIGAGVIGHWISPVATNKADPDEWIKVDSSQLKARNGLFSLRFGEPM
ncbi:MAG TPA: FG-GAP-like repeat-containing protein, partial [Edaphobacter sp.]|nr:FG-GAP-like repeat-containing protein [Edaphobacter sp.]